MANQRVTYEPWDGQPVPPERWAKDHHSLLLYAETCAVDRQGRLGWEKLRGHRQPCPYPTIVTGSVRLDGHDDLDGLIDLLHAGHLELVWLATRWTPPDGEDPDQVGDAVARTVLAYTAATDDTVRVLAASSLRWAIEELVPSHHSPLRFRLTDKGRAFAAELRAGRTARALAGAKAAR